MDVNTIIQGDALEVLSKLPDASIQCCISSPPYFGLRDYQTATWEDGDPECTHRVGNQVQDNKAPGAIQAGVRPGVDASRCKLCGATRIDQQIGLEETPETYVDKLVQVFREVRRVLRDDGTCWINLGDSYFAHNGTRGNVSNAAPDHKNPQAITRIHHVSTDCGLKPKDLIGIPWSVAKALQQPYYTGKIANERDRVWLAATLDAEGSICGFTHERKDDGRTRTGIHITITNTNKAMLDNAQRIWATTRIDHNLHGKGHYGSLDTYRWIAHSVDDKSLLLRELYPYFIAKQKQALLAWNFLELSRDAKHLARTREAQEIKDKRAWLVHAISRLNHFEDVDIPNWCIEPSSLYEPGWYLRSDIIWNKPTAMPESVTDRPTKSHEYLFLFAKSERYYYDADAIREPLRPKTFTTYGTKHHAQGNDALGKVKSDNWGRTVEERQPRVSADGSLAGANKRTVWTVASQPFSEAHFATFPPKLIEPCILAGTSPRACEHCGSPWERVTEPTGHINKREPAHAPYSSPTKVDSTGWAPTRVGTDRWEPTCTCSNEGTGKCIVLDPFMGAGTTALVAIQHGRNYLGIELNPSYVQLAEKRIATVQQNLWSTSGSEAMAV